MYRKFIITLDGEIRFGTVYLHRDLLPAGDPVCFGGGLWEVDKERQCIILFGRSFDFGTPDFSYAKRINKTTFPGNLGYPLFYRRNHLGEEQLEPVLLGY
ncbi:MAG: hypothetical protein ACI3ZY_13865 [Parabacteroides sp.]